MPQHSSLSALTNFSNVHIFRTFPPILEPSTPIPFEGPTWTGLFVVFVVFQVLCIVTAAAGNILVCIAVCTDKHLRKRSNSLYVSLAVADLLIALFVMTSSLASSIMGYWAFPMILCDLYQSLDVMCSTASILNICAIAFDRYMHIQDPFNYESKMTRLVFAVFIFFIWLLSGLISFVPFRLGWHMPLSASNTSSVAATRPISTTTPHPTTPSSLVYETVDQRVTCILDLNGPYAVISSCISFFIPLTVTLGLYCVLYRTAREHAAKIKSAEYSYNGDQEVGNEEHHSWRHRRRINADNKAQLTLGIIMGLFLACWLPFFTVNIALGLCRCISDTLFNAFTWLGYCNSCVNPVIYTVFNKDFRNAFRKIVCGCRRKQHELSQSIGLTKKRPRATHTCNSSLIRCPNDSELSENITVFHSPNKLSPSHV